MERGTRIGFIAVGGRRADVFERAIVRHFRGAS
jgi:hypothetical protein